MNQSNVLNIKKRAKSIQLTVKIVFYGLIILSVALLIIILALSRASQESFTAIKDTNAWSIIYKLSDKWSFNLSIPFKIIQPSTPHIFSAKSAFLIYLISVLAFRIPIILYGIKQILDISTSTVDDVTPFKLENAIRLKKLGNSIIAYSLFADLFLNILNNIFVVRLLSINLSNILHIEGILAGILILAISGVFKYGVYLQNEYDATL
jgi:hypothetical protein